MMMMMIMMMMMMMMMMATLFVFPSTHVSALLSECLSTLPPLL
jgi:hypothetical protein